MCRVSSKPRAQTSRQASSRQRLCRGGGGVRGRAEETCLCWVMRGISTSWLGEAISWRRCGVDAEAFCLFRHMQTKKKRHAMTRGMAMLGTKMYRIPILLLSWGPGNGNVHSFFLRHNPLFQLQILRQPTPSPRCNIQAQVDDPVSSTEGQVSTPSLKTGDILKSTQPLARV